jgi:hypothetical protein
MTGAQPRDGLCFYKQRRGRSTPPPNRRHHRKRNTKMGILDLGGIHRLNTDDISLQTSHPRSRTPVQRGLGRGRLPTLTTESPPPWGPFPPRPNRRHGGMSAGPWRGPPRILHHECERARRSPKDGWLGAPSESNSWILGLRTLSGSPTPYGGYRATWGDARSRRSDPRSGVGQLRSTPSHKHAANQDGSHRWRHPSRVPSGTAACCPCPCHWPTCCGPASSPGQAGKDSPQGLDVQPPLEGKKG